MNKNSNPPDALAIGMEIGGTKIQVGIGSPDGVLLPKGILQRQVVPENGAEGIRRDLVSMTEALLDANHLKLSNISKIGIGFGGPLNTNSDVILKSYQIDGWDHFPLKAWAENQWGKPVFVQNDASLAGLAEALHGNGRGYDEFFI